MKNKIILISLLLSFNLYSKDVYFFNFYGFIKDYHDFSKPIYPNQIRDEKYSNFYDIFKNINADKYVHTFVGSSIGDISNIIYPIIPRDKIFQCNLLFDDIFSKINNIIYKNSVKKNQFFIDIDLATSLFFTTCPIKNYHFLNNSINNYNKNETNFIFFVNSYDRSLLIINKIIKENKLNNYKIFIKNQHFLTNEDLFKFKFDLSKVVLFYTEKDIINFLPIKSELKDYYRNQKVEDIDYLYNIFKIKFIEKHKTQYLTIDEDLIKESFNTFFDNLK